MGLNRAAATIDDWIFSYDKIPDPILVSCGVDDSLNMTEEQCRTDIIPSLRVFEGHDNMTEEVDLAMMYWGNRSQAITFSKFVKQYALSFYWSALTLVTLGEQPSPNNTFQNLFEICDTLLGLVLFAVIVGDVGNMVTTMNMKRSDFEEVLDGCKSYMIYRKVHRILQRKTIEYFSYTWAHGGGQVDEEHEEPYELEYDGQITSSLQEIEEFLPQRLYANVRSVGYSDLYVLSKDDLWTALREYPEAKYSLMEKGKNILAKDNMLEEVADEQDIEQDAPIEEQLESAARIIREIEAQLDEAEKNFKDSTSRTKHNLFKLEQEMDAELRWIKAETHMAGRPRAASHR
ncbi:unnamed protein product [Strongylus vulgaris]|uniref:Ion transport domain-containing protein n=1 Tax=Strongylus vulgaris TaxID=40348 RepID=A0A3P7LGB3_STRVU|nr:unnamed protein product [Strongylus vulgaris]